MGELPNLSLEAAAPQSKRDQMLKRYHTSELGFLFGTNDAESQVLRDLLEGDAEAHAQLGLKIVETMEKIQKWADMGTDPNSRGQKMLETRLHELEGLKSDLYVLTLKP